MTLEDQLRLSRKSAVEELYSSLPLATNDSFRLLRLKAGSGSAPIECYMYLGQIHKVEGTYSALSYVWGTEDEGSVVLINERPLPVRKNLHDFLWHLRDEQEDLVIWADAICINQASNDEKSHQVRLMRQIYSQASRARLWLGNNMPGFQMCAQSQPFAQESFLATLNSLDFNCLDVLMEILQNPYWTRLWILQEVVLARIVSVHCGSLTMEWNQLLSACRVLTKKAGLKYLRAYGTSTLKHLDQQRTDQQARSLPQLIKAYHSHGCAVLHDRVYGLLGLVTQKDDPLDIGRPQNTSGDDILPIDYDMQLPTLYQKLMNMYGPLPAESLALPLFKAFHLLPYNYDRNPECFHFVQLRVHAYQTRTDLHDSDRDAPGGILDDTTWFGQFSNCQYFKLGIYDNDASGGMMAVDLRTLHPANCFERSARVPAIVYRARLPAQISESIRLGLEAALHPTWVCRDADTSAWHAIVPVDAIQFMAQIIDTDWSKPNAKLTSVTPGQGWNAQQVALRQVELAKFQSNRTGYRSMQKAVLEAELQDKPWARTLFETSENDFFRFWFRHCYPNRSLHKRPDVVSRETVLETFWEGFSNETRQEGQDIFGLVQ